MKIRWIEKVTFLIALLPLLANSQALPPRGERRPTQQVTNERVSNPASITKALDNGQNSSEAVLSSDAAIKEPANVVDDESISSVTATNSTDGRSEEAAGPEKPKLTGNPQLDYIHDPNLPHELKGYDMSSYPFYNGLPKDMFNFTCDDRHDGFYASIPHKCQVYHNCLFGQRYDFLCANFTLFDQKNFICHFASEVDCPNSDKYYFRNDNLYETTSSSTTTATPPQIIYIERPPSRPLQGRPEGRRPAIANRRPQDSKPKKPQPVYDDYYHYDDSYDYESYDDYYYDDVTTTTTTTTLRPRRRRPGQGQRGGQRRPGKRPRPFRDEQFEDENASPTLPASPGKLFEVRGRPRPRINPPVPVNANINKMTSSLPEDETQDFAGEFAPLEGDEPEAVAVKPKQKRPIKKKTTTTSTTTSTTTTTTTTPIIEEEYDYVYDYETEPSEVVKEIGGGHISKKSAVEPTEDVFVNDYVDEYDTAPIETTGNVETEPDFTGSEIAAEPPKASFLQSNRPGALGNLAASLNRQRSAKLRQNSGLSSRETVHVSVAEPVGDPLVEASSSVTDSVSDPLVEPPLSVIEPSESGVEPVKPSIELFDEPAVSSDEQVSRPFRQRPQFPLSARRSQLPDATGSEVIEELAPEGAALEVSSSSQDINQSETQVGEIEPKVSAIREKSIEKSPPRFRRPLTPRVSRDPVPTPVVVDE